MVRIMDEFTTKIFNIIKDEKLGKVYFDKTFKDMTTLKVGGKIHLVFMPFGIEEFIKFYDFYWKSGCEIPLFVIGNGSNILASDKEYKGIVVSFKAMKVMYYSIGDSIYFFPQCKMSYIAKVMISKGYSEVEYFSGIPGSVGGTVAMNGSFLNKSIGDYVEGALVITRDNKIKVYNNKLLNFSYRSSEVKENSDIVLLVKLRFPKGDIAKTKINYNHLKELRKEKQPLNALSAGCAFKNPSGIKAWKIIKELGYSGKSVGGAKVSEKHCNFIINDGSATSNDIYKILESICIDAKEKKNIILENEWILINFD